MKTLILFLLLVANVYAEDAKTWDTVEIDTIEVNENSLVSIDNADPENPVNQYQSLIRVRFFLKKEGKITNVTRTKALDNIRTETIETAIPQEVIDAAVNELKDSVENEYKI